MQFINDNFGVILVLVNAVAVFGVGFILVPYLKKRGIISETGLKNTQAVLQVMQVVLNNINLNQKSRDTTIKIFDVCEIAVRYVEQVMTFNNNVDKKKAAVTVVKDVLAELNIEVNQQTLDLIEVGIEAAVSLLPKTNK